MATQALTIKILQDGANQTPWYRKIIVTCKDEYYELQVIETHDNEEKEKYVLRYNQKTKKNI